jgi:DtxR family Mn-dependent transcriptional regulator
MIKRLARAGLVAYAPYHSIELTVAGRRAALAVVRHHRLLELYMAKALGIPWDRVHEEADRLEHGLSGEVADALARVLGEPSADPHGDPIPNRDLELPATSTRPLSECQAGERVVLDRVAAQEGEWLRYLGERGLFPGVALSVRQAYPDGAMVVGAGGAEHDLPSPLTRQLYVRRTGD